MKTDHDKIMLVHDALAEGKDSDKLYLAIYEHYQDARFHGPCSECRDICARLIGGLVIEAIRMHERATERKPSAHEVSENDEANHGDTIYDQRREAAQ